MNIVKVVNKSDNPIPKYATDGSAGVDLRANITEKSIEHLKESEFRMGFKIVTIIGGDKYGIEIYPGGRVLVPTGLYMDIPRGFVGDVRPRSGLALKHGITVLNADGTIDSDYRGEVGVILHNSSSNTFTINNGDRIAQLIISPYEKATFAEVVSLSNTDRGKGGFGSTGKN